MKLQNPIRTVLILVAALMVSGCALKPKTTSRFHSPASGGSACDCFTCRNAPTAVPQPAVSAVSASPCTSCDSFQPGEAVIEPQAPQAFPATPWISPAADSNNVESFNTDTPALEQEELPVVNEITPGFDSSSRSIAEPPVSGGSFQGIDSSEAIVVAPTEPEPEPEIEPMIAAPVAELDEEKSFGQLDMEPVTEDSAPSIADAVAEAEEAAPATSFDMKDALEQAADSATTAPDELPTAIEAVIPEVPTPAQKIAAPKPANKFKPGQPFRARKQTSAPNNSTWDDLDTSFYQHGADEGIAAEPETAATSGNSELASFFTAKEDVVAKRVPSPRRIGEGRVVLRADKVDRNVIYTPPAKSTSVAVVPPLNQSFRTEDESGNWLRHGDHAIAALPPQESHRVYEVTESARIASNSMAAERTEDPIFETLRQQKVVRLKAIPLGRSTNYRQAVIQVAQPNVSQTVTQRPIVNTPAMAPITVQEDVQQQPVRIASPPQRKPSRPYTARSTDDDGVATPPWRTK